MLLKQGLWAAILSAGITSSCNDKKSEDDLKRKNVDMASKNTDLQNQNADLQNQNTDLQNQLAAELAEDLKPLELHEIEQKLADLKSDTLAKESVIEERRAEIDALRALGDTASSEKISALNAEISASEAAIAAQKTLVTRLEIATSEKVDDLAALFRGSITPYAGVWILDPKPALSFPNCQFMVRFDAYEGSIYRVALCEDGKMQAELQSVAGFTAKNNGGWSGTLGFNMDSRSRKSSCGKQANFFQSGTSYSFDHSVGTASAANEAALFMTTSEGEVSHSFKSGSSIPDLGKNKNCSSIVKRSKLGSQTGNLLLQQAAKVCLLTRDLIGAGCFKAADQFEAAPGAN